MIKAEIVAHSLSPQGDELISVLCTFPRIILAEVNTHRMLSKNTSSSRAIPFNKMVEAIKNDPFIPIAWQKEHKGMQGNEYFNVEESKINRQVWLEARDSAVENAQQIHNYEITKQLANRLLEPFMWTTMLITGSKEGWDNFFHLRCPSYFGKWKSWRETCAATGTIFEAPLLERLQNNKGQAEIHMMTLAESIYDAINESTPKQLQAGEWHIPFEDKINMTPEFVTSIYLKIETQEQENQYCQELTVKISTAMAAHTSYTTIGNEPVKSYEKWIELHDKLIAYEPPHSSPMEHCARVMSGEEYYTFVKGKIIEENKKEDGTCDSLNWVDASGWCYNLKGFIPYRYMIDNKTNIE